MHVAGQGPGPLPPGHRRPTDGHRPTGPPAHRPTGPPAHRPTGDPTTDPGIRVPARRVGHTRPRSRHPVPVLAPVITSAHTARSVPRSDQPR
jgi:hypothetical protein